ncbi:hypothetical protein SDC9_81941 [bioreactor metagenome]|uniref:Uncharacterized protein n=1 Tax=bioreactor metagenome TaxID=1076179 RepID=A0A644Z390_9ZZZZ
MRVIFTYAVSGFKNILGKSETFYSDDLVFIFGRHGNNVKIYRRRDNSSTVVVGMISGYFASSGNRKH